jgi:hypothetical protein
MLENTKAVLGPGAKRDATAFVFDGYLPHTASINKLPQNQSEKQLESPSSIR